MVWTLPSRCHMCPSELGKGARLPSVFLCENQSSPVWEDGLGMRLSQGTGDMVTVASCPEKQPSWLQWNQGL